MEQDIKVTAAYKAAETYEQFFVPSIYRYWTPLLLERAIPQPGERVLDVACGTGVVARAIVPLVGLKGKVIGLDINPAMLAVACRQFSDHCDEIDWREGRAENLPFSDHEFDLVTCQQGFQFFNRPLAARDMARVLRPKGRISIAVWQYIDQNPFYKLMFSNVASVFNIPIAEVAAPFSFKEPNELKALLVEAGFETVKVEPIRQDVHFQNTDRFVELTVKAASVVIPAFTTMDGETQAGLLAEVTRRVAGALEAHTKDGVLSFPMAAFIATGIR